MLELSSTVEEPSIKATTSLELESFIEAKRLNSKAVQDDEQSVEQLLLTLQERFSHTDDFPKEVESLIEEQVQHRTNELFRLANYDDLTHLPNRAYFNRTLEQLVMQAKSTDTEFTLMFLDLDGFKNVNDTFGHHSGDELLRNVGARLISAVREGDIVSRLGGDEFVILLAGLSDRILTEGICRRIIAEVSRPYYIDKNDVQISTSIGVACYPADAKTSTELVEKSDKALYVSKDSGRNTFSFFVDVASQEKDSAGCPKKRLESALKLNQIQPCFEPKIDLESKKIIGASLSLLWMDEALENPYLAGWTDVLNQSEWAESVGYWLIDSGLHYLQQWQPVNDGLTVSIPVIDALWKKTDLVPLLARRIAAYNVKASKVRLEFVMPTVANPEFESVLMELSDAGYRISLTGVGKSSLDLALLTQLNVCEIKLDALWLQDSLTKVKGRKWLRAVIQMARIVDIDMVAMGIQSNKDAVTVFTMGCSFAQGSHWALPLGSDDFYHAMLEQLPEIH